MAQAKQTARTLEKVLERNGIKLQHGKALDTLAAMCGFTDWNAFSKRNSPEAWNHNLQDFELRHIAENKDSQYGPEVALIAQTGFQLRYAANSEKLLDYVRVTDPLGRETAYWAANEWSEDPQVVMGAILGALVRCQPVAVCSEKPLHVQEAPCIQDVDFFAAFCVLIDGQRHDIDWIEETSLEYVYDLAWQHDEANCEPVADYQLLSLTTRDDDNMLESVTLSVGAVVSLRWDANKECFIQLARKTSSFRARMDSAATEGRLAFCHTSCYNRIIP